MNIADPPPKATAPTPAGRPRAAPTAPTWDPFAPAVLNPPAGESPEAWVAAYQRGERRRFGAQPDVVLYFENPRACAPLPKDVPSAYEITLIHTDREEGGPVTEYGVTARPPCVLTTTPLHFEPPAAACSIVDPDALEAMWIALRAAELSEMKVTPPELPNPGFAIAVTWLEGHCFVDGRGQLDPASEPRFYAAKDAIATAFNAGKRR